MLDALIKDFSEFFAGRLYDSAQDQEGAYFEYALADDQRFGQRDALRNTLGAEGGAMISTCWEIGFEAGKYVLLADGCKYRITSVVVQRQLVSAQVNAQFLQPEVEQLLSLTLVGNPRGITP